MDQPLPPRHRSFVGPIILIVLGGLFLMFNLYPDFNPWPVLFRYWPLILILIGLGKIWDSYYWRHHTGPGVSPWISGTGIAWILLLMFFILMAWHGRWRQSDNGWNRNWGWETGWHGHAFADEVKDTQSVELQGAKSVDVDLNLPAGALNLAGGSSHLMEAEFHYDRRRDKPNVSYSVSADRGQLRVNQDGNHWHTGWDGGNDNDWDMKVANGVPLDLHLEMGAGQSNLHLNGVQVKDLDVHMGAGQLDLDLTGPRTISMNGTIEGGVGQATVRLPKDVGVHVEASGGIGSVDPRGLKREGDAYVNDAYGKTPTNIELTIHGGIGSIRLLEE
jgi:uncharacterized protein DUF2154/cell wall-active antibiotic response 4TMS protein YvqF